VNLCHGTFSEWNWEDLGPVSKVVSSGIIAAHVYSDDAVTLGD